MANSIKVVEAGNYINFFVNGSAIPVPSYKKDTFVRPVNLEVGMERYAITGPFGQEKQYDLTEILNASDQPFTVGDWTTFYTTKTGNFSSASGGSGVASVTGTGVDNTDPSNPIVNRVQNEGRVKINGSGGVQPSYTLTANVDQVIDYGAAALDLSASPTTEWPQNIVSPTDGDIWNDANDSLIENPIPGQVHNWRVIFDYSGKPNNSNAGMTVFLRNPLSGFEAAFTLTLPSGRTADTNQIAILTTIADGASLPPPVGSGQGYELVFNSNLGLDITVTSVTRISNFHNER